MDRNLDPELADAIRIARHLSRRSFLRRAGIGAGAVTLGPALLAACGDDDDSSTSSSTPGGALDTTPPAPGGADELVISNWDLYIDADGDDDIRGEGTTLAAFEAETGISVDYRIDYNDNGEYFSKFFQPVLGTGKTLAADIVCPTYWMAARIIGLGWTDALLLDEIPNHENLEDAYLGLPWDPGANHFMPWQAGITGIAWNPELTGGDLTSINDLFDPKLKGKVAFLSEMRDSVGLTMLGMGTSPAEANVDDINAAIDKLEGAVADGQILKFTGNEYAQALETGDIAACVAWSGDITQIDPALGIEFVIPEEGGMQWFDAMVVPKGAPNNVAAARWMNYVYDPENAARITQYVQFISPVKGVREALEAMGGDAAALAESPILFPDEETQARLQVFGDLSQEDEAAAESRFSDITG